MDRTIRRTAAVAVACALLALPAVTLRAGATSADPDDHIVSGASLAAAAVAVGAANPDFDVWPVYSSSVTDNNSSHGLSAGTWPGFLIDAFMWLYGFQSTERAALGISESQWPNPPHESAASSSTFMLNNFSQGCAFLFGPEGAATDACRQASEPIFRNPPGQVGASESSSGALRADGRATATRFSVPGVFHAAGVRASSDSRFVDGRTVTTAVFTASDVTIGADLNVSSIVARSVATAGGTRETSSAASTLQVVGARWGDQPVEIDDQGVHLVADRSSDALNEALAAQGLEVRLVRGRQDVATDGETANATTGGLLVRLARDRAEEAFPLPVRESREAACAAVQQSPFNQEVTRVRVDQPNPLFGQVPFAPLPERVEAEQSVPPPYSCPFLNRSFEIAFVLGVTDASARLSPLPALDLGLPTDVLDTPRVASPASSPTAAVTDGAPAGAAPPTHPHRSVRPASLPEEDGSRDVELAAAFSEADVARKVKVVYGVLALLLALGLGARFALRSVSSP